MRTYFIAAATMIFLSAPAIAAVRLKVADNQSKDYPTVKTLEFFAERLKTASKGEIKLKVYHSGQLGQEKDIVQLLKAGAVPMARLSTGTLNGIVPETQVINLPYIFRNREHMYKVLTGPVGEKILQGFEKHGMVGLTFLEAGARSVYNSKKPVKTPKDLEGLKIRVMGTEIAIALVEELGASATPMNFSEVYGALQTKVIDGAENNFPSFYSERHLEVASYFSKTEHMVFPEVLVISKKTWTSLTPEQQKVLRAEAMSASEFMKKEWENFEKQSITKIQKAGVKINEVDKAAFIADAKKIYPKFIKDEKLQSLITDIQKVQ